jgi:CRP/FNR family transcriptional regulator, cyclic AMP receptor protein
MVRLVPRETLEMLAAVPLFAGCGKQELRRISGLGTPVFVDAGTALTTQGQPGNEFFLMVSGAARCVINGAEVGTFGPGDSFGEMSLLSGGPRVATIETTTPAEVLVLDRREFASLIEDSPKIAVKLLKVMAERVRRLEEDLTH